ncbi:hydroxymethylglutaryl-CoA reductase [Nocardia tengchongensis]|uniref:hydroxymethylglutaryl-CoA reductase n=1 Tax=Nocardia tengchongensis TaxID=2055889 RepID=UPI00369CCF35
MTIPALDRLDSAAVPTRWIGPLRITGNAVAGEIHAPLATYESPLWPSVQRGARVSMLTGDGIVTTVTGECMTRSILLDAPDGPSAAAAADQIIAELPQLRAVAASCSRFCELTDITPQIVGHLLYLRLSFRTGDASGHNMTTLAADRLLDHLLAKMPDLRYGSISANLCTDKKPSAVNGLLGRGKYVITELLIPRDIVRTRLHTTAAAVTELNIRKNLIGTTLAGGIRSANAHYANMLLGFYLATGQDAANIIEGSQGITHTEDRDGDLYFSCTLPNVIVGSVGNGKDLPFVEDTLAALGCRDEREPGANARRLAAIAGAVVLCGELSLMAAQTNPGELMAAHLRMERKSTTNGSEQ